EDENAVEVLGEVGSMQHPDDASARELVLQPFRYSRLGLPVEGRGRLVEDQEIGTLKHLAGYPRLLTLGERQPRSAGPDIVIKPDLDDDLPQGQLVDHLGNHGWDADRCVGLAVSNLAEQNIVLYRGGRVIALRIKELDLRARLRRKVGPKHLACFE